MREERFEYHAHDSDHRTSQTLNLRANREVKERKREELKKKNKQIQD